MIKPQPFIGPWRLADLGKVEKNGLRAFSCFHCGGGSTMGYKLAGIDMLGGVEIDPQMMALYRENHHPKHSYLMGVGDFNALPDADLPAELFDLDILDGSPPCSVFSMAGKREKKWGKETHFREGQARQVLDDLFFTFIETAGKLKPKVIVAENVKGLIVGNARGYVLQIFAAMRAIGYRPQLFLLNASRMGVPQRRERTFFIATRNDLEVPPLALEFVEPIITIGEAFNGVVEEEQRHAGPKVNHQWHRTKPGDSFSKSHPRGSMFNLIKLHPGTAANTLTAACHLYRWDEPRLITQAEAIRLQSFPDDYARIQRGSATDLRYVCGMSVPPFMTQRVALEIGRQVFGIDYDRTRRPLA